MTPDREALRRAAEKATPGPWHHCQPYMTVPAERTVHGRVPAARVDYVSTWPDIGMPPGHRVIIDMPGRESRVSSSDMAFIAIANPATILALLDAEKAERDALQARAEKADELVALYRETAALEAKACDEAEAKLAQAVDALEIARDRIQTWPLDDQETCMCGSLVQSHDIGSGHSPVTQGDHAISLLIESLNKTLATLQPEERQ